MYRDRCDKCGKLSKYVFRSKWDTALYIMHFCKITNTLTRPIRVSVLTCWRFWIDWEGLLIRVAVMLNPIYWSQALSPMSLSDRPLALMHTHTHKHTHTHTQTQPHLHARDWNQPGRHSSMNQMSATSHRERRGAFVNYCREKSHRFTCKTCYPGYLWIMKSFSFFPSWDKTKRRHNFNEWVFKSSD